MIPASDERAQYKEGFSVAHHLPTNQPFTNQPGQTDLTSVLDLLTLTHSTTRVSEQDWLVRTY